MLQGDETLGGAARTGRLDNNGRETTCLQLAIRLNQLKLDLRQLQFKVVDLSLQIHLDSNVG